MTTLASGKSAEPAAGQTDMQHLVLINPPALLGHTNERTFSGGIGVARKLKPFEKDDTVILPIDFLYTAAVAERVGARVTLVDLLLDRYQGEAAIQYCRDCIGEDALGDLWIGVRLCMPSLQQDLAFANHIKQAMPSARVFVFGAVIMATIDHWIRECRSDYVLYGEPEALISDVLQSRDPSDVPGVIMPADYIPLTGDELFDGERCTRSYAQWVKVANLSDLPRPAWHLLDMPRYAPDGTGDTAKVGAFVQASRGCPIGCNMCPYALLEGKRWRKNEVEAVVDEIEYLNKAFGIYRIRFRDPNFGFNRKYAADLCEAIIRRGVRLEGTVETSIEVFDEKGLRLMADAGIHTITTGIETDDPDCMASIGQKIAVNEKLRSRIDLCHKIGFHVYGTFCLGAPEETWDSVRRTWMLAREMDVESGFTVMTPFPGTPMYWRAIREGLLPKRMQYSDWNSYTSTMRTSYLTTHDLDIARLWSRLETIIPYRAKRVRSEGTAAMIRFRVRHIPHFLARWYCRMYVWYRNSRIVTDSRNYGR